MVKFSLTIPPLVLSRVTSLRQRWFRRGKLLPNRVENQQDRHGEQGSQGAPHPAPEHDRDEDDERIDLEPSSKQGRNHRVFADQMHHQEGRGRREAKSDLVMRGDPPAASANVTSAAPK